MAQNQERHDELPPDPPADPPAALPAACASEAERRIRLSVVVPPTAFEVLKRHELDPMELALKSLGALWQKYTPERGPADKGPYAGEVCYFQRLLDSPSEVLTMGEQFFVLFKQFQDAVQKLSKAEGSDLVRREVRQAAADIAEWVANAQKVVRIERGEDAPKIDWEVTEP